MLNSININRNFVVWIIFAKQGIAHTGTVLIVVLIVCAFSRR